MPAADAHVELPEPQLRLLDRQIARTLDDLSEQRLNMADADDDQWCADMAAALDAHRTIRDALAGDRRVPVRLVYRLARAARDNERQTLADPHLLDTAERADRARALAEFPRGVLTVA